MRSVLDPNVLVAALLARGGKPAALLRLWLDGAFELIVSPLLVMGLRRVLKYPKIGSRVSEAETESLLALLSRSATLLDDPREPPSLRSPDPNDDHLIALAEVAQAVVVSGDKHLLGLAGRLPVYTPAEFYDLVSLGPGE